MIHWLKSLVHLRIRLRHLVHGLEWRIVLGNEYKVGRPHAVELGVNQHLLLAHRIRSHQRVVDDACELAVALERSVVVEHMVLLALLLVKHLVLVRNSWCNVSDIAHNLFTVACQFDGHVKVLRNGRLWLVDRLIPLHNGHLRLFSSVGPCKALNVLVFVSEVD